MTRKRRDKMRPFLRLTSVLTAILLAAASQAENKGLPELSPEELERYQFEIEESEVTVTDLSPVSVTCSAPSDVRWQTLLPVDSASSS